MVLKNLTAALLGLALVVASCNNGRAKDEIVEDQKREQIPADEAEQRPTQDEEALANKNAKENPAEDVGSEETVTAVYILDERVLAPYINTSGELKYVFKYASETRSDKITFENGKATLTFDKLPAGASATVWLNIYEGDELKLEGTQPNVTLKKNEENKIALSLRPVEKEKEDETKLIIDLSIEDTENDDGSPSTGGGGDKAIAKWDGRNHLGNDGWNIETVSTK